MDLVTAQYCNMKIYIRWLEKEERGGAIDLPV
jgi:hypothetical protein